MKYIPSIKYSSLMSLPLAELNPSYNKRHDEHTQNKKISSAFIVQYIHNASRPERLKTKHRDIIYQH